MAAGGVEERHRQEIGVLGPAARVAHASAATEAAHRGHEEEVHQIGHAVPVGPDRTLGLPGGPRGVEDGGVVVRFDGHVGQGGVTGPGHGELGQGDHRQRYRSRPLHGGSDGGPPAPVLVVLLAAHHDGAESRGLVEVGEHPPPALLVGEEEGCSRVTEPVGQLGPGPPGVEGHDDGAHRDRRPEGDHPLGQVAHGDGHPVALGDPEPVDEGVGQGGHRREVLGERDPLVLVDQEVLVPVEGGQLEHGPEGGRRALPGPGGYPPDGQILDLEELARGGEGGRRLGQGRNRGRVGRRPSGRSGDPPMRSPLGVAGRCGRIHAVGGPDRVTVGRRARRIRPRTGGGRWRRGSRRARRRSRGCRPWPGGRRP